ncbi:DUF4112 domain-containing protein [Segetibacter sp. 3557_3]|uniref:DUF4112 domain-containing protein n=1 Tax=Segetibacter sp. 3557_3 TaxID=2547429 RepID=UPI0010588168|nr:DUF4112 domain-containing protein [Segetibacter sp. 3557_3]TDH21272.1 DUF4112 domain-containing protein [Segetibacter sp. 3557_3]
MATVQVSNSQRALRDLDKMAKIMDSQFSVPGTNFRFGLDAIIGLVPGAGDMATFAISGYMLLLMARNGASGFVMARMVFNVLIDTVIGAIPILGDIFDIAFKANTRNMRLMHQHFKEGRHRGSAWKLVIPVLLLMFLFMAGIIWLVYTMLAGLWSLIAN